VNEDQVLAERFEASRAHLQAAAYRMLGSQQEADDAVQEAWLRLSRSDVSGVDNLRGWLTTVVARVCLDMLRSRKSRREEPLPSTREPEPSATDGHGLDPEQEAVLADSVGLALLVVLDNLAPAERVAFVLHDMFDLPFNEIGPIVGRSPTAARQLASRARRRVRGVEVPDSNQPRQREIVDAFLGAARGGNFAALLAVLDPEVVFRADRVAVQMSAAGRAGDAPPLAPEIRGASAVVETFRGRLRAAQPALVNGAPALAWTHGGQPAAVLCFTVLGGRIAAIDQIADPERIRELDIVIARQ
jgi:RNA polymerase sigma-70 factor (ECF subfamily)